MKNDSSPSVADVSLKELFLKQMDNQDLLIAKGVYGYEWPEKPDLPFDNVRIANNQMLHLVSEIGEVLEADKRWKSFRNDKYDPAAKADELADCFIILLNIAMFSGIGCDEFVQAIQNKIEVVKQRVRQVDSHAN